MTPPAFLKVFAMSDLTEKYFQDVPKSIKNHTQNLSKIDLKMVRKSIPQRVRKMIAFWSDFGNSSVHGRGSKKGPKSSQERSEDDLKSI